ncbi:MAG: kelch repeat-containing protein, partial [Pseudomonadota bacterium]
NTTYPVGNMHAPRAWHTANLLSNGKVLIVGGFSWDSGLATAELFDPTTNKFEQLGYSMAQGRGAHTATLLKSGKILIAGGFDTDAQAIDRAEIYDPLAQKFKPLREKLNSARAMHSAVLLNNGKVLLAGGSLKPFTPDHAIDYTPETHVGTGELYDPVEDSFMKVPRSMAVPRARHQMVETKPGTVIILGGGTWQAANQLEIFNYVDVNVSNPTN